MRKSESIRQMQDLGLNTLDCLITDNLGMALGYLYENAETKVSIRTERRDEFGCPFFFMVPGKELIEPAKRLLAAGYKLLLYPALDTAGCLAFGTVALPKDGSVIVEFVEGPGKVRELDNHPQKKSIILPTGKFQVVYEKDTPICHLINEIITDVCNKCYNEGSVVVEWSYYGPLVGNRHHHAIYWELRPYEI